MVLSDEKYLLLTTFRRSGVAVATAVWAVPVDGDPRKIGFYTSSGSGKAKRLAHTNRVTVQPSDSRGRPRLGTEVIQATAEVVTGEALEAIRAAVTEKYGFMTKITKLLGTIGGIVKRNRIPYADRDVIVTLD